MNSLPFDSRDLLDPGANWCPDCGLPVNHPECRCDEFFEPTEEDWQRVIENDCQFCPDCGDELDLSGPLIFCTNLECGWQFDTREETE